MSRPRPLEAYYNIDITTGCWNWLGYIGPKGYANYKFWGKTYKAHRFVYEKHKGPIPVGMVLDHLCRNRKCVNPEHLEPVTSIENSKRGNSYKLTEIQVIEIREKYTRRCVKQQALAIEYNVDQTTISKIILGISRRITYGP